MGTGGQADARPVVDSGAPATQDRTARSARTKIAEFVLLGIRNPRAYASIGCRFLTHNSITMRSTRFSK